MSKISETFLKITRQNTAVTQLKQLIEETIDLVETHLPQIDTAPTRKLFTMQLRK